MTYLRRHGEVFLLLVILIFGGLWVLSQLFRPFSLPQKSLLVVALLFWIIGFAYCLFRSEFPFFKRHAPSIALAILIAYVVVLGLATVAEIFGLNWFFWL